MNLEAINLKTLSLVYDMIGPLKMERNVNSIKYLAFLFCFCAKTILYSMPVYTISEFNIQELKGNSAIEIIHSYACKINDFGKVVGYCTYYEQDKGIPTQKYAIFIWDKETGFKIVSVDTFYKRFPVINNNGFVAWTNYIKVSNRYLSCSCLWDPVSEQIKDVVSEKINAINDYYILNLSFLESIDSNNANRIIGVGGNLITMSNTSVIGYNTSKISNKTYDHYFIWNVDFITGISDSISGIGNVGEELYPYDVNDFGCVVGQKGGGAFLWKNGKFAMIQSNAKAVALNNNGDIVGMNNSPQPRAFIFKDGIVYDLLSLVVDNDGWSRLEYAADINDSGQIVGHGIKEGKLTGFFLSPL